MHALPIASCGLRLENEDICVAVGQRLGAALCQAYQCPCGALVQANGLHGLSCKLGSGKHSRHASINDIIYRACCRADIPAVKELIKLTRTDGKRPDGSELGYRISVVTGDMRETTFLFQRLSIAIQRFNCILFKSSFIDGENVPESFLFE